MDTLVRHSYLADLLTETRTLVRRFVVVGDVELDAIAIWNAHTYVYDLAPATPYLTHTPEPGSGKTTLLDVLAVTAQEGDPGRQPHRGRAVPAHRRRSRRCYSTRSMPFSARRTAIRPRASGRS